MVVTNRAQYLLQPEIMRRLVPRRQLRARICSGMGCIVHALYYGSGFVGRCDGEETIRRLEDNAGRRRLDLNPYFGDLSLMTFLMLLPL